MRQNPLSWILLHTITIFIVIGSLLTGLRIATLTHPSVMFFSALLPQGYLHEAHILFGFALLSVLGVYLVYLYFFAPKKRQEDRIHRSLVWFGYVAMLFALISGALLYLGNIDILELHFYGSLATLLYIVLHTVYHVVRYGSKVFGVIVVPQPKGYFQAFITLVLFFTLFLLLYFAVGTKSTQKLEVSTISNRDFIEIDGEANEPQWAKAKPLRLMSFGGANFEHGATPIEIKALKNEQEIFLFIRWRDATKSMKHLPLLKRKEGWSVVENGFYKFDEVDHYEDKLAVMLSNECSVGASKTIHLGSKPLADKPANWHGKGYHYSTDGAIRDLWQWKAVRTNDMFLADDDYFGSPDIVRSGSRRYTAGYLPDAKDSGAYIMNWKWYKHDGIVPKRLPKEPKDLEENLTSWVVPWYHYDLYKKENDHYPVGTLMPSVLYASNTFEGDRANVRARAKWSNGWWSLELVRPLNTGSTYDVPIKNGVCMWVSAFDHAQIAHTRHAQAIEFDLGGE